MNVSVIGLGSMGFPIARNLLKAGHQITVYNRTREKAETLIAEGAVIADTLAEAGHHEIAITMLSDDSALETASNRSNK